MPRRRSAKDKLSRSAVRQEAHPSNVLQANKGHNNQANIYEICEPPYVAGDLSGLQPLLCEDNLQSSNKRDHNLTNSTAALHDELDSFRQRWKRELEVKKPEETEQKQQSSGEDLTENKPLTKANGLRERSENLKDVYALAKKLFLKGVDLEQDEMHYESIRYYKQAMHLCPDIEKEIFREQCEASLKSKAAAETAVDTRAQVVDKTAEDEDDRPSFEKIKAAFYEDNSRTENASYCRPSNKTSSGTKHIANLPHDLILQIFRYVVGKELDLASLESLGLVCRGFHILSRDPSLWRSICYTTWSEEELNEIVEDERVLDIDWRHLYLTKPRVNCDGVYISRTRYIRQGDVGFQDITYRPFHVVRYYRYLRFFPDGRVLVLTTNEDPDKIIPIFRHALHSKQFSSELSILEGTYELVDTDELIISAEKDFTLEFDQAQQQTYNQRRQARFHWSRQTPLWQKFNMRFKLKTYENRPFRNNVLKWLEYSILSRTELGQELTEFDLGADTFPPLAFSRVKKFNLRLAAPLLSH